MRNRNSWIFLFMLLAAAFAFGSSSAKCETRSCQPTIVAMDLQRPTALANAATLPSRDDLSRFLDQATAVSHYPGSQLGKPQGQIDVCDRITSRGFAPYVLRSCRPKRGNMTITFPVFLDNV